MKEELIVLVDNSGKPKGTAPKLASHHDHTPLHLAFSCYVFDNQGKFLMTQRALSKKVWPGVWTNSVCGHPAPEENMVDAIKRRLDFELGMSAKDYQVVLPDYRYTTPPYKGIIENEVCPVYVARAVGQPESNPEEVEAHKWVSWKEFIEAAETDKNDLYSWWCKDQLKQLKSNPIITGYAKII